MPSLMLVLSARNRRWKLAIEMLIRIPHIQRRSHNIPLLARTTWQPEEVLCHTLNLRFRLYVHLNCIATIYGRTPRTTPTPKESQTVRLLTNPRQPKKHLHRHHRLRRSSHPGSTPRMITTLRARVVMIMQPFGPRLLRMLLVEVSHGDRLVISTRS
jgi:hypothetical protein